MKSIVKKSYWKCKVNQITKWNTILNNVTTANCLKQKTLQTIKSLVKAENLKYSAIMQLEVIKGNSLR